VTAIERRVAFSEPPAGRFQLALLLCEWTFANGYVERDRRDFRCIYERSTSPLAGSAPAPAPASVTEAATVAARPVDRLRLVPTVEPEVAPVKAEAPAQPSVAPVKAEAPAQPGIAAVQPAAPVPGARALVSVQTGSLEELAGVQGLSFKIAKEIIKARPFSSLADLIRVRGLGQKTIDRIKHLVKL
jgi:competence protein ComEA